MSILWPHQLTFITDQLDTGDVNPERESLIGDIPEDDTSKVIHKVTIPDVKKTYENPTGGPISRRVLGLIRFLERDDSKLPNHPRHES